MQREGEPVVGHRLDVSVHHLRVRTAACASETTHHLHRLRRIAQNVVDLFGRSERRAAAAALVVVVIVVIVAVDRHVASTVVICTMQRHVQRRLWCPRGRCCLGLGLCPCLRRTSSVIIVVAVVTSLSVAIARL